MISSKKIVNQNRQHRIDVRQRDTIRELLTSPRRAFENKAEARMITRYDYEIRHELGPDDYLIVIVLVAADHSTWGLRRYGEGTYANHDGHTAPP